MVVSSAIGRCGLSEHGAFARVASKCDCSNHEEPFLEQLGTIDRAIRFVCHRDSLREEEAEDLASAVKLKLIENNCAVIRKHALCSSSRPTLPSR
jgi:hypothetical protein